MPSRTSFDKRFLNRELSLLKFNHRVLEQAQDKQVPLLERLKFLTIVSSNMDEFFEVRVGVVKQKLEHNPDEIGIDGRSIRQLMQNLSIQAHELIKEQYDTFNNDLLPELAEENIALRQISRLNTKEAEWLENYFIEQVLPILSPIAVDQARPFPMLLNKALNFIVRIEGKDAFKRKTNLAIIPVPRSLPRVVRIPSEDDNDVFITLASIIRAFKENIFPGIEVEGCYSFRVTRNSDLYLNDEEVNDLLRAVKGKLANRHFGEAVRLETSENCPKDIKEYLLEKLELSESELFPVEGPINMHRLMHLYEQCDRPELKYSEYVSRMPNALDKQEDYFSIIRERDILVHHPYQSFACVLEFLRQAAVDPQVLAIKQTLYRTEVESPIIDALVKAAQNGKEVTVIVELMARFDEARNVELADHLYAAGVHVLYGVVGFKTHAKACLIMRNEDGKLIRYAHVATGNYHPGTARVYTDYGFFSSNTLLTHDLHNMFLQLSSLAPDPQNAVILQAPFSLLPELIKRIKRCTKEAMNGSQAKIIAKLNSLSEPEIIEELYLASQAGVKIELIVRGICCLRPQVKGLSENIKVRSILGRFLEHTRVYHFDYGNEEVDYFLSSADWMTRNLRHRVEVAFPIDSEKSQKRILRNLDFALSDESAWMLNSDGNYKRVKPDYKINKTLQSELINIHG